jgi:hypothetical protein
LQTDNHQKWIKAAEILLAAVLLCGSVVAIYASLAPSLQHGQLAAGDDSIHSALSLDSYRIRTERGHLFDWSYLYGMGAPIYIFRPPGFYLTVQVLDAISFGHFAIQDVHKFGYLLGLALFPCAVFYLLRKFRFPWLVCGIGAVLAIAPVSTWGHTIDAYYDLGLAKQVFAILLFPFTLGKFHGIMARKERLLPGALLFGLMFLSHPYMGLSFLMVTPIYVLFELLSRLEWRHWLQVVGKSAAVVGGGLLLISFWMLPFYSSDEIHPTKDYSSTSRHSFTVITDTASEIVHHYLRGSLFDQAKDPKHIFGKESAWKWRDTRAVPRWPILSYMSLVGALAMLLGCRYRRNVFFLTAWFASLVIFMGPDDIPLLRFIPFQSQFQYIHFVPIPELFVVCLASFGIYVCIAAAWLPTDWLLGKIKAMDWQRAIVFALVAVVIGTAFLQNVCKERYTHGQKKTRNRTFEVNPNGQTEWSIRAGSNKQLMQATDYLCDTLDPFERFYGSPTAVLSGVEIFNFTLAPAYMRRTDLISPLFGGLMGGVNNIIHTVEFRRHLWKSDVVLDLLNVGSLITSRGNVRNYPVDRNDFPGKKDFGAWTVFETDHSSKPFDVTFVKPVMFIGDSTSWQKLCESWLRQVMKLSKDDMQPYPFMVWARDSRRKQKDPVPLSEFSAIYVADPSFKPKRFFSKDELARFKADGKQIYFQLSTEHPTRPTWSTREVHSPHLFKFGAFPAAPTGVATMGTIEEDYCRHTAEVEVTAACRLFFKSAFYRGWRVEVDGERVKNTSVSPGFNGCYLEPGKHKVEFTYHGANRHVAGKILSLTTLLGFLAAMVIQKKRKQIMPVPPTDGGRPMNDADNLAEPKAAAGSEPPPQASPVKKAKPGKSGPKRRRKR